MPRPSLREPRRRQIALAFLRVLGTHGREHATIAAAAAEAGVVPGLVHHYFTDKHDLHEAVLDQLIANFHGRIEGGSLDAYIDAALALDARSDVVAARAFVGLLADALADPALFDKVRRMLDAEVAAVERRAGGKLSVQGASAVVAFVVGALVFGAFAPRRTAQKRIGFAAPSLRRMLQGLISRGPT